MKVARGEIEEFTQEDILGSESDERKKSSKST